MARLSQPLLCRGESLVGPDLARFDVGNRLPSLRLARVQPGDLVLGSAALASQHLALAVEPQPFLTCTAQLGLDADQRLLVLVQTGGGLFDGVLRLPGHRRGRGHAHCQVCQRLAFRVHARAHFLDLALGGQDTASVRPAAAHDDMPAACQLAVERGHIQACRACRAHGRLPRLGDIPASDHRAEQVGIGTAHAHEIGDADHAIGARATGAAGD